MRVEGVEFVIFCICESVDDGLQVSLYLILVLCNVDGDDYVCLAGDENTPKEKFVFFSEKWYPCLRRA